MKKATIVFLLVFLVSLAAPAQNLTPAQKESDFRFLTSLHATYYAPYEWKKQLLGFDLLDIKPWLARVAATKTDLDFYEVCVEYVASLNDSHEIFSLPSDFVARLPITADIYDGKLIIETINRTALPQNLFPFAVGDEIVSVDGRDVAQLLTDYAKYAAIKGNPISTRRYAAAAIVSRSQVRIPHAPDVGDSAAVVVRRQSGALEPYAIPWLKTGTPLEVGPVPFPRTGTQQNLRASKEEPRSAEPDYMSLLNVYTHSGVTVPDSGVIGFGARNPVFVAGLPSTFTRRMGGSATDFYYSGTFKYDDLTIGYIRIPNYSPPSQDTAQEQPFAKWRSVRGRVSAAYGLPYPTQQITE